MSNDVKVRTFWILNNNGEKFDLMCKDGTNFFHAPQGLGQSHSIEYYEHITMRRQKRKRANFQTLKGEMIFANYRDSHAFRRYVNNAGQNLYLFQKLPGIDGEYYAEVEVTMIDRKEIDVESGKLKCEISFECLTFWTKEVQIVTADKEAPQQNTAEVYPYVYAYTYANSAQTTSAYLDILVTNNGDIPAPLKITISGQSISPEWQIGDERGGMNYTIQSGAKLIVDSREDINEMTVGDMVVDKFKKHELKNYLLLPTGENKLTFKNVSYAEVIVYEYYLSI